MYSVINTTYVANGAIKVKPHDATFWDHAISFGSDLTVYLTNAELLTLCNEATRVLADKWADAASDESAWNNYRTEV